jgi:hypothetical protein
MILIPCNIREIEYYALFKSGARGRRDLILYNVILIKHDKPDNKIITNFIIKSERSIKLRYYYRYELTKRNLTIQ